jgi:hypothetical protein
MRTIYLALDGPQPRDDRCAASCRSLTPRAFRGVGATDSRRPPVKPRMLFRITLVILTAVLSLVIAVVAADGSWNLLDEIAYATKEERSTRIGSPPSPAGLSRAAGRPRPLSGSAVIISRSLTPAPVILAVGAGYREAGALLTRQPLGVPTIRQGGGKRSAGTLPAASAGASRRAACARSARCSNGWRIGTSPSGRGGA